VGGLRVSYPVQPASQTGTIPSIKGHHLGESIEQFRASSPVLRAHMLYCRQHPDKQSGLDEDIPLAALMKESGMINSSCTEVLKLYNPSATVLIRQGQMEELLAGMSQLFGEKEDDKTKAEANILDFSGSVRFENGRVDLLELRLPTNWENSERDLYAKFGKPTRLTSQTVQNGYGARNELANVFWEHPDFVVHAYETISANQDRGVTVEMVSRSLWDRLQQQENSRPNSID
jgi:hypothetical protein